MSQENVKLVRDYFAAVDEVLAARAADPPLPIKAGIDLLFERFLQPDAEWWPPFTPERFRGREGFTRAVEDWLDAAGGWRVKAEDVTDAGGDTVLAVIRVFILGKGSGAAFEQRVFTVITVVDRRIARVNDLSDRAEALEAVGLDHMAGRADRRGGCEGRHPRMRCAS